MKLSTELRNLPIVSIAEGEEVGFVKDFIIDPESKSIVAIVIEDTSWYEGAKVISFSLIHSIGDFAITTENISSVVSLSNMPELTGLIKKELSIIGGKVITRGGRLVGYVKEFSIDDRTGEIIGLELKSDANISSPDLNVIPASSVATIGKDIIIVNEDIEASLKGSHEEVVGATGYTKPVSRPVVKDPVVAAPEPVLAEEPEELVIEEPEEDLVAEEETAEAGIDSSSDVDIEELLDLDAEAESAGLVEEPGVVEIEEDSASDEDKQSLSEIFERRQIKYMLGKKVSKDIISDGGSIVVNQGETITEETIQAAKSSGKFLELSMNIEIEE